MWNKCLGLWGVLFLFGCATEQRLGEGQVQKRRYTKGYHVQHHRNHVDGKANAVDRTSRAALKALSTSDVPELKPLTPVAELLLWPSEAVQKHGPILPESTDSEGALMGPAPTPGRVHIQDIPDARVNGLALAEDDVLPDPVFGRHPSSVPGFILSLGWALGLIGEAAIAYLAVPLAGVPIALGIVATVLGYFLSRKAFRTSLAHPDLYPRFKLSRAGRWVAAGPLLPVALYLAVVLVYLIILGIF